MKEVVNIIELLGKIKIAKQNLDNIYKKYIDEESDSRALISIYNPNSNSTINGDDADTVSEEITDIYDRIHEAIHTYQKLMFIKEEVNAFTKMKVPCPYNIGEDEVYMSIAQILVMKSPQMKKYIFDFIDKLDKDCSLGSAALAKHQEASMSTDRIDRYVIAKLNSLNIKIDKDSNVYKDFSKEYRDANHMELLDPLGLSKDGISDYKTRVLSFYDKIDSMLLTNNANTKIWIDLDSKDKLWGLEE